ncbi:amino acid/peptide transporter (Peptide:H+ symporter) [Enterococcus moraviensis ATCC BAA-383]|uniref:Di-/tripeptide transporter n=1 Tax=Enterococcus moraviensis ATCC BAA-383 TaxID=1158609 RepID=R2U2T2_9ENTE|nr:peptide MFS transporter [Enterococcus moraviensis]EOI07002.1 amino acid/peptide transporter (Peptide:H+ symporter) [Enterococcus moraviensis ATCC BAA-383]EOT65344.1 di-/tripeptide transporter [Enterococcus moraviensis ATCC BAA-383]OJG66769.1 amino acid/peptide transporter (Peptide:H+ symporter) [Enterococcus moraviensis]
MDEQQLDKSFLGQPKGLSTLFFTEMWERFSYYGMRAILLYYIYDTVANGGLGLPKETALAIMSIYGSLVFMSSIVGGWISDRVLGARKTVFFGGAFIMVGHIVLATPFGVSALFLSIFLIVIGTGMLKPNVSGMVGHLYSKTDTRRDAGFSIFYMGINIGALLAPFVVGTLGQTYNYHVGFSVAAFGMFFGLLQYYFQGKKSLSTIGLNPTNPIGADERKKFMRSLLFALVFVIVLFGGAFATGHLTIGFFINSVSVLGILLPVYYFIKMLTSKNVTAEEKPKVLGYIPLFLAGIVFWSLEEQGSSILALFASERTNDTLFGFSIAPSWFQSLNPIFVVVLTPVFVTLWTKLGKKQPSTVVKFSLGLVFAGLSFVLLMLPGLLYGTDTRVSPLWLFFSFFIMIVGEMCISPVGLSITTKLAPKAFESQTVAIWLLADAASQAINAQIARFYTPQTESAYFGIVGIVAVIAGILLILSKKPIKKLMGSIH